MAHQCEVGGGGAHGANKRTNHTARGNRGAVSDRGIARAVASAKATDLMAEKEVLIMYTLKG